MIATRFFYRFILGLFLIFFAVWAWRICEAWAFFSRTEVLGGKISLGDWQGPRLEIISANQEGEASGNLKIKLRAADSNSRIKSLHYSVFSHQPGDDDSDWVEPVLEADCFDGACDESEEESEIVMALKTIQNPDHKLCPGDNRWCLNKPLPQGNYYLEIWAHDESGTVSVSGNQSEKLVYSFYKKNSRLICDLDNLFFRAGEAVGFGDISCENEPALIEVKWDFDKKDGVDFENPDFSGISPTLEQGYVYPGTYEVTVKAKNEAGEEKEESFLVNVSNPWLGFGDLLINEIMPDPVGEDKALLEQGEWIEVYNRLGVGVDLLGFAFYDSYDSHDLPVTRENCKDGITTIGPYGYLVVYRNGDENFSLNNSGREEVRFFDGFLENNPLLLDGMEYDGGIEQGMVLARIPDGQGDFEKTQATKGRGNE
ncbi:MAG: lamin tail domain-containing protein [Patescibacteria group bacterium]|nr:lamin tail domain-containing protein [Patescibacteria group bacterium]